MDMLYYFIFYCYFIFIILFGLETTSSDAQDLLLCSRVIPGSARDQTGIGYMSAKHNNTSVLSLWILYS